MSTKKEVKGIVTAVQKHLKMETGDKLVSFYNQAENSLLRKIKTLENNSLLTKTQYKTAKEDLENDIQDAMAELRNAYLSVDESSLDSLSSQKSYVDIYIASIEDRESNLESLTVRLEELKASNTVYTASNKQDISSLKDRIDMFNSIT